MDVSEFQKKLEEICNVAEENNKKLTTDQVREHFQKSDLDKSQLLKILQYLKIKGISIEGAGDVKVESTEQETVQEEKQIVPLTLEEEAYLKEYRESLIMQELVCEEVQELFEKMSRGDAQAKGLLVQNYLAAAADMAVEMNCSEIFLADLIQEANLALIAALEQEEPVRKNDKWLREQIRNGIVLAIHEQTERKLHDDSLVAKVEKLESAIRELTEDEEEGESKFTIDELAIILDMDVDEMRDVLRLTGDDQ